MAYVVFGLVVAAALVAGGLAVACRHRVRPGELLVIAGRRQRLPSGEEAPYAVLAEGSAFVRPLTEAAYRIPTTPVALEGRAGVRGPDGTDRTARFAGRVRLATESFRSTMSAIERFLGRGLEARAEAARPTLEEHLEPLLAATAPEDLHAEREALARRLAEAAGPDLARMGLGVEGLEVQPDGPHA